MQMQLKDFFFLNSHLPEKQQSFFEGNIAQGNVSYKLSFLLKESGSLRILCIYFSLLSWREFTLPIKIHLNRH